MRITWLRLSLLSLCLATAAQAEPLGLRQALVLGLESNFDLRVANLEVERAEAGIQEEAGRFDVVAELGVNTVHSEFPADSALIRDDLLTTEQTRAEAALDKQFATGLQARLSLTGERNDADSLADRLDPSYRTTLVLDVTQPLLRDRGMDVNTADLRIARTRQQQSAYDYLASAQQLAADIEQTYLDLAQAQADHRFAMLACDLARELLAGNRRKLDAGLVPVTEVNQTRTALATREATLLLSRQRIATVRNRLLELIDQGTTKLPADWRAELPPVEENDMDLETALETGLRQRPDLQKARLELTVRDIALVYADNQRLPRLDLEASFGVNGLSGDAVTDDSFYDGAWQQSLNDDGNNWYAGLRFSMPLQNRLAKARYRDAAAQDRQALYRLQRLEAAAITAIRSAHATLMLGHERLQVARESAELAQLTLDQETSRLEEGLSDTFRVLNFQDALINAKASEVAARTDFHRARANLSQATGTTLERHEIVAALPHQGAMP